MYRLRYAITEKSWADRHGRSISGWAFDLQESEDGEVFRVEGCDPRDTGRVDGRCERRIEYSLATQLKHMLIFDMSLALMSTRSSHCAAAS